MGQGASVPLNDIIDELCQADVALASERWSALWTTPVATAELLFDELPVSAVRNLRNKNPGNFSRLITKLVEQLRSALTTSVDQADNGRTLQCVRLLSRVIPLALEEPRSGFADRVFWQVANDAASGGSGGEAASRVPLAITLLDTLVALLFLPGFTINEFAVPPPTLAQLRQRRNAVLPSANVWAVGVGSEEVFPSDAAHCSNRVEVLKLLLVCLSATMYDKPSVGRAANSWLHYVCTRPTYYTAGLFNSLLNVACTYDPVGWGLPYNYLIFSDPREELTYVALQLLTVLLEYEPTSNNSSSNNNNNSNANNNSTNSNQNAPSKNVFARYLAALPAASYAFVFDGLAALLANPHAASRTYLPASTKELLCQQEALSLLWRVLLGAPNLVAWLLTDPNADATKVMIPLLIFMLENRRDEANLGLVHLGTFILLLVSGERAFGQTLNAPFGEATDSLGRVDGCVGDLLVLTCAKLLVDSHDRLAALHECLLTVISNVSPYIKALNAAASAKLVQLFEMFSKPKFLLTGERHPRYIYFLLETFNNIVQYQYEGNARLVYSLVRYANAFRNLNNFRFDENANKAKASNSNASRSSVAPGDNAQQSEAPPVVESVPQSVDRPHQQAFKPTAQWVETWQAKLPLGTTLRLLDHLEPIVKSLLTGDADDDERIFDYLRRNTLVGVLPVPHPIVIRKYQHNAATSSWFHNFMWGVIFTRNTQPPLFYGTRVRLFAVSVL